MRALLETGQIMITATEEESHEQRSGLAKSTRLMKAKALTSPLPIGTAIVDSSLKNLLREEIALVL